MDFLLFNTLEVLAIADWAWQTRLNTLLMRAISLVVEARALSEDVARLIDAWHKGSWKVFLARLRRQTMEMEYMQAHVPASGQPNWQILQTPQFRSYRLVHLAVLCAHHRDCDRLVQLWLSRVRRIQSNFRLYPLVAAAHRCIHRCSPSQRARYRDLAMVIMHWLQHQHGGAWLVADAEQDASDDDFDRLLVDGEHFAFDSQVLKSCRKPMQPAEPMPTQGCIS